MSTITEEIVPQEETLPLPPAHFAKAIAAFRAIADTLEQMDQDGSSFDVGPYLSLSPRSYNPEAQKSAATAFARAFAPVKKDLTSEYNMVLTREYPGVILRFTVDRKAVCRKVKVLKEVEVWECDPLLSDEALLEDRS